MKERVVVLGGGVIGRCVAHYAALRGFRVTLLDRHGPDHPGCSTGNAGYISPSHFTPLASPGILALAARWMLDPESPFYVRPVLRSDLLGWGWRFIRSATPSHVRRSAPVLRDLALASRSCFVDLADRTGNAFSLVEHGCLTICATGERFAQERSVGEEGARLGLRVATLGPEDLRALEPGFRMDVVGGVHYLDDCHVSPGGFMTSLLALLREEDVEMQWGRTVQGFVTAGTRVVGVRTAHDDVCGDHVVVAAGVWSGALLGGLGLRMPIQAGKGYSLTLDRPPVLPSHPMICSEGRLAVTPFDGALRFGGTMEVTGLDETVNPARIRGLLKAITRYFPDFTAGVFRDVQPWVGLRPLSPDGLPYVGRVTSFENLYVGAGHAMMGVTLAPVTGLLLAELLNGSTPSLPLEPLSPQRFA